MKKKIAVLLAVLMLVSAVGVLSSCGKKDDDVTTTAAPDSPTETLTAEATAAVTDTLPAETQTEAATAGENDTEAPAETQTEAPRTVTASASDIAAQIAAGCAFEETLNESNTRLGLQLCGIDDTMVEQAAYYAASAAVAEEILVVKVSDPAAVSDIVHGMEERREVQIEDYADYVPKEVPKLEKAVIYPSGDWIVFCVSNDGDAAQSFIEGLIG